MGIVRFGPLKRRLYDADNLFSRYRSNSTPLSNSESSRPDLTPVHRMDNVLGLDKAINHWRNLAWPRFEPRPPKWHTGALSTTPRAQARSDADNPTIVSYNASVEKPYVKHDKYPRVFRINKKHIFFIFVNCPDLIKLQWCSCKCDGRRVGAYYIRYAVLPL
jgi:hypothetical protein